MAGGTNMSTKDKAAVLALRSFAVACSSASLTLFAIVLVLHLAVANGEMDDDCAYKILPLAGTTFSTIWHLLSMIAIGSDYLQHSSRIVRTFHLTLEAGICLMLAVLGYLSFAYDRLDPEEGYTPAWGEQNAKIGAVTILSVACACHIGFFVAGLRRRKSITRRSDSESTAQGSGAGSGPVSIWKHTTITTTRSLARRASPGQNRISIRGQASSHPPAEGDSPTASSAATAVPAEDAPAYTRGDYQTTVEIGSTRRSDSPASATSAMSQTTHALALHAPTSPRQPNTASEAAVSPTSEKQQHSRLFTEEECTIDPAEENDDRPESPGGSFFSAQGFSPAVSPTQERRSSIRASTGSTGRNEKGG